VVVLEVAHVVINVVAEEAILVDMVVTKELVVVDHSRQTQLHKFLLIS
jgi:hypothetical protein